MDEQNVQGEDISPEVLRRALKALDEDSRLGKGAYSGGPQGVCGIQAPNQYRQEVWDELCRQGKLKNIGHGLFELPRFK